MSGYKKEGIRDKKEIMKNNITIKDFVKAGKAAGSFNGHTGTGPAIGKEFLTDGRIAIALSSLADRSTLITPVDAPKPPAIVNCTTEDEAKKRDRIMEEARTAQKAYEENNTAAIERLELLTGRGHCRVLQESAACIWKTPAKIRAFRFTGLIWAQSVGLEDGGKRRGSNKYKAPEICIFEEIREEDTARKDDGGAYLQDYLNEPEKPAYGVSITGCDSKERAPFAPRRIGINRVYVELLEIGADIVFMDAEKELGPVFCEAPAAPGATIISGALVMPVKAA